MWDKLLGVAFALLAMMLVGLTLFLVLVLGGYLWEAQRPLVVSVACAGAALGVLLLRWRSRHLSAAADHEQARIHPGISMHAIPI